MTRSTCLWLLGSFYNEYQDVNVLAKGSGPPALARHFVENFADDPAGGT